MERKNLILIIATVVVVGGGIAVGAYNSLKPKVPYTISAGSRPFEGREDAKVVVDEYGDFQCPACRAAFPYVKKYVEEYGANVRFNFKHFPLESVHANALNAALAAECANDQGKFWQMHDIMYEKQPDGLDVGHLKAFAGEIGLNQDQFNACLDNQSRLDVVRKDQADGFALNLNGTPSFVLNGTTVISLRDLEPEIRKELGLPPLPAQNSNQ